MPSTLTNSFSETAVSVIAALKAQELFLVVGEGSPAWDADMPPPNPAATSLLAESLWVRILNKQFVAADPDGEIAVGGLNFSYSIEPTRNLFVSAELSGEGTLDGTIIREAGVYSGTVVNPDLPGAQVLFSSSDIITKGSLIIHSVRPLTQLTPVVVNQFRFIISF